MAIEILVGLHVSDDNLYQTYRNEMSPLLLSFGGRFVYDFKVSDVLKSEVKFKINRVFTIYFKSEELMNSFFTNKEYIEIKKKYFEKSVTDTIIIATYER